MLLPMDGAPKRRLTEREELVVAAEFLMARGFAEDEIAVQLSRFYYVDIDALNDVVAMLAGHHGYRQHSQAH
ncbi:MAG: hypothetical protein M9895_13360 [Aquamicrobium sp.]|uniref:hypothetical protein n=1 Tax=Aquamicrobium sp. TaxID=1872579 RepID=UPI00349E4BA7|nr:hypothetical protein [Aquamicrobium sp.]